MILSRAAAILPVAAIAILQFVFSGICTAQPNGSQPTAASQAEVLRPIVSQFIQKAASLGCDPKCKIVTTDFTLAQGYTSGFGIQIAQTLGALLSNENKGFAVVDRSRVQDFVEQERLTSRVVNQPDVARWLARKLNADIAVTGETIIAGTKAIELAVHFSDARAKHNSLTLHTTYRVELAEVNLNVIDTLRPLPPLQDTVAGNMVYRAGTNGVGLPSCSYMPNPPFTEEAKTTRFSGRILVEGLVDAEGKVKPLRIVTGAPGGLNESTFKTLATWRCRPALRDSKPVPVVVPFEVSFQLY